MSFSAVFSIINGTTELRLVCTRKAMLKEVNI